MYSDELDDLVQDEYAFAVDGQTAANKPAALRERADMIAAGDEKTLRSMGWEGYSRETRAKVAAELRRLAIVENAGLE